MSQGPQKEDGFTPIANELLEALQQTQIPLIGLKIMLWVMRNTYGWSRPTCKFSWYQVAREICLRDDKVSAAGRSLIRSNALYLTEGGEVGVQKHYKKWQADPEAIGPVLGSNTDQTLKQVGPKTGPKQDPKQGEIGPKTGPISRRAKASKAIESNFNAREANAGGEPPKAPQNSASSWPEGLDDTAKNRGRMGLDRFPPDEHPLYFKASFEKQTEYQRDYDDTRAARENCERQRELNARLAVERAEKAAYDALPQEEKDHLAALKDDAIFNMKRKNRGGRSPNVDPKDLRSYKPMPPPDGPTP